jgi:hypothetical protein
MVDSRALRRSVNIGTSLARARSVFLVLGVAALLFACVYDMHLRFLSPAQSLATVVIIGAAGTLAVLPKTLDDIIYRQRIVVGGVAALIVYTLVAALAPWSTSSLSALLSAAGVAVLMVMPADRVPSWMPIVVVVYVIVRSAAFFSTTFLRGVQ